MGAVVLAACSDGTSLGTPNGPSVCPQTVAAVCAQETPPGTTGIHCASTLAAAETDTGFCASYRVTESTCGTLTVLTVGWVDTAEQYYYDASGALIAITGIHGDGQQRCVAGDGTFAIPHAACTSTRILPACDADAGAGGSSAP
jgi:hypothetical protein